MKNKPRILCLGGANIDLKLHLDHDLTMKTSNPVFTTTTYGGVARNIAENLGRLDCDVALLAVLGDDQLGNALLTYSSAFMDVSLVERSKLFPSGCYYAIVNPNGEMELALAAMDLYKNLDESWMLTKTSLMGVYDVIVADMNISSSGLSALIAWCQTNHRFLALIGVSGPKMANLPQNLENVDLIIVNKDETQKYFCTDEDDLERLCALWKQKGLKRAIVTAGKTGIAFFDEQASISLMPVITPSRIVDVTGAGDSFSAGVIFGLSNHFCFTDAIRLGRTNATKTIQTEATVRQDLTKTKLLQEEKQDDET